MRNFKITVFLFYNIKPDTGLLSFIPHLFPTLLFFV
jgi:hypothetical protein